VKHPSPGTGRTGGKLTARKKDSKGEKKRVLRADEIAKRVREKD